jgi:PAS domain S-box-containing protein
MKQASKLRFTITFMIASSICVIGLSNILRAQTEAPQNKKTQAAHETGGARTSTVNSQDDFQLVMESWNSASGLQQNSVVAIVQSPDGFLWAGTQEGIARFDGTRFIPYSDMKPWANQDPWVQAMAATPDGALWVGTSSGLNRFKDGKITTIAVDSKPGRGPKVGQLPESHILSLWPDREGALWIGTREGLARYHQNQFQIWTVREGLPSNVVLDLAGAPDGSLWIATNRGLGRMKDGRFSSFTMQQGLSNDQIRKLYIDRLGILWVGTNNGLNRLDGNRFIAIPTAIDFSAGKIMGIAEDEAGRIWVGADTGLGYIQHGQLEKLRGPGSSLENKIATIYGDREGNIWIGTKVQGLNRLRKSKFSVIGKEQGLSDNVIDPVLEARDGSMWVGTDNGLNRIKDNRIETYSKKNGLIDNEIISLHEARDGTLWVGTLNGLCRLNGKRFDCYTTQHGLTNSAVLSAGEEADGSIWFGTYTGLTRYKDGKFDDSWNQGALKKSTINDVLVSSADGSVWISTTYEGIFRLKNDKLEQFTEADGLPTNLINSISEDPAGYLWIGTEEGLARYQNGAFKTYSMQNGLSRNQVFAIIEDNFGNLWLSSNHGIQRITKSQFDDLDRGKISRLHVVNYGLADGMRSEECNASTQPIGWKRRDGKVMLPTINGLVIIDPSTIVANLKPPKVFIDRILAGNNPLEVQPNMQIPAGVRDLQIDFTAISFPAPEKLRFKYKLEGSDAKYIEPESRRFAVYNGLTPGYYKFHVVAWNAEDPYNSTTALINIRLKPAIYETWWFMGIGIMALCGMFFGLYKIRLSKLKERTLEKIALSLPTAMAVIDGKNSITMLNNQFESLFGYSNRDISSLDDWFRLAFPDRKDRLSAFEKWKTAVAGVSPQRDGRHESQVTCKDGSLREIEFRFARIQESLVVTLNDVTERNRAEAHLHTLASRLQTIREEEREFISREIHDELGQLLTGLKLEVKWLENKLPPDAIALRHKTASILELINDTIKATRSIATEFRPSILDSFGLMEAIEWQVQDFEARAGIRCDIIEKTDTTSIDRDRATALFRILQESLTNVARHAQATVVIVSLSCEEDSLVLQIEDDGRGITEKEISGTRSLGLLGMRERVRQFNGYVRINGIPGEGTTITASVPLEPRKEAVAVA